MLHSPSPHREKTQSDIRLQTDNVSEALSTRAEPSDVQVLQVVLRPEFVALNLRWHSS